MTGKGQMVVALKRRALLPSNEVVFYRHSAAPPPPSLCPSLVMISLEETLSMSFVKGTARVKISLV
jgi:hypothetical protein